MDGRAQQPEDFATAFESAFARLQVRLEMSCTSDAPWPERAVAAIRQALEFAAADPAAANVLTNGALTQGVDGLERYERLMAYLGGLLTAGRAEIPHGADPPPTIERSLAGGVAAIVANRVDRERGAELPRLLPEVIEFVLTPYLGSEEAKRLATMGDWPGSQPDR
jgi:hypothetical protein